MPRSRNRNRRRTLSAACRLAVTLWMGVFLLVIAPGHTRGIVQMDGGSVLRPAAQLGFNEAMGPGGGCCGGKGSTDAPYRPTGKCVVCQIILKLDLPTPIIWAEPLSERLGEIADESSDRIIARSFEMRRTGRAPPARA